MIVLQQCWDVDSLKEANLGQKLRTLRRPVNFVINTAIQIQSINTNSTTSFLSESINNEFTESKLNP